MTPTPEEWAATIGNKYRANLVNDIGPPGRTRTSCEADIAAAIRAAVETRDADTLAICEEERLAYLANARKCDASGNTHGGTFDTACSLACERIAARIRARKGEA